MTREVFEKIRKILRQGAFGGGEPLPHVDIAEDRPLHAWPSGIEALDKLSGGLYDLAVIAGGYKLGKSLAALLSALEAADQGWRVFYFEDRKSVV